MTESHSKPRSALCISAVLLVLALAAFSRALSPAQAAAEEPRPNRTATSRTSKPPRWPGVASSHAVQREEAGARNAEHEENIRADHPDEETKFRRLRLEDESGHVPVDGWEKARKHLLRMMAAQQKRLGTQPSVAKPAVKAEAAGLHPGSWMALGPYNVGGRIRSILIDPTDPSFMWVGSVGGGIFVTSDGGVVWSYVPGFAANLAVSTMAMDPTNPKTIYAGTGEGFFNVDALQGAGVFKSTDLGVTWTQLSSTDPTSSAMCPGGYANCPWTFVNRLAISPDGTTILAATNNGCLRSTDGGATWVTTALGTIEDVVFHPTDSTKALLGSVGGVLYSTDGGTTWKASTFNPKITNGGTGATNGRVELAYAPSNGLVVYASVNNHQGDVFESTDGGVNFKLKNTGIGYLTQGSYANAIWVNPLDPTYLIVGGLDLWLSTDSGNSFTQISDWTQAPPGKPGGSSVHADHHVIVAEPRFDNMFNRTVYFGNDGGIYATNDISTVTTTSGWFGLNGLLGLTQMYSAAGNASTGVVIGGAQDNGTARYSGAPQAWSWMFDGDGGFCAADATDSKYFYGEYEYLTIVRSTDGGKTASYIYCDPSQINTPTDYICDSKGITDAFASANFIAPFILDPNNHNTLLGGGLSLWRSTDIKDSVPQWTAIKAPTGAYASPCPKCISAIAAAPGNSDFIVVGHGDGSVFLTQNGTAAAPTWTNISGTLPGRYVGRVAIDASRSTNWIYAGFGGFNSDNIYRSTDLGTTWTRVTGIGSTALPAAPVYGLAINPLDPDILYAGTEVGVFISEDAGATWEVPQDGPANIAVEELSWMGTDLLAATHGRGVYRASGNPGLFVDCNARGIIQDGSFVFPYKTITAAINAAAAHEEIWIRPCNYNEQPVVTNGVELHSLPGGAVTFGAP